MVDKYGNNVSFQNFVINFLYKCIYSRICYYSVLHSLQSYMSIVLVYVYSLQF